MFCKKTMKNIKFATRFALILSLTAIIAVGVVGYQLSVINQDTLKSLTKNYYNSLASKVKIRLELQTEEVKRLLLQTSELFSTGQFGPAGIDYLNSALSRSEYISLLGFYDAQGRLLDALRKGSDAEAPPTIPQEMIDSLEKNILVVGRPLRLSDGLPVIPVATRWSEPRNNTNGIALSFIENSTMSGLVSKLSAEEFNIHYKEGTFLVDDSLYIVGHDNKNIIIGRESQAGKGIFTQGQFSFDHEISVMQEYKNPSGEAMVGFFLSIPALRIAVVVEQPESLVYASVQQMRASILISAIVIAVAAVILSIFVARQLAKPIASLVNASEKLALQDFSIRLDDYRSDEFGLLFQTHNRVAEELERYHKMNINKIVSARNKLESVVRQASDGIIVVEPSRHILVLNDVFARWFGVPDARVTDDMLVDRVFMDIHLKHAIAKTFIAPDPVVPVEFTLQLAGEVAETVLRGSFIRVMFGTETIAVTGILRDVTREVAVDRMKTELVSIVAHELRSPLSTMRGFSELIRKGDLPTDEVVEFAEIITTEADRLNGVITKFLDINRIESGRTEIQNIPFKLHDLIQNVLRVNMPLAEQKQMNVVTDIPQNTTPILGDPELVGQVFLNLFSNAVKYSDAGKQITVQLEEEREQMRVSVTDQGYGISESAQEKLFSKFFRATDDDRVRDHVGTGLGLAFIKEIVEKHGGKIGVHSQLNKGSTFWFVLPK